MNAAVSPVNSTSVQESHTIKFSQAKSLKVGVLSPVLAKKKWLAELALSFCQPDHVYCAKLFAESTESISAPRSFPSVPAW